MFIKPGSLMLPMYLQSRVGVGAWATSRHRQLEPSQSITVGMPAKLNLNQLRRHTGGKDWDDQCCRPVPFSYQNSFPGSTGGHVAGALAA